MVFTPFWSETSIDTELHDLEESGSLNKELCEINLWLLSYI
jgi:hypothetical protein